MRELVSRLVKFAAGPLRGHVSWRFWAAPEGLLGASWRLLGSFLGPLGGSFEALGGSWGVLGPFTAAKAPLISHYLLRRMGFEQSAENMSHIPMAWAVHA